MIPLLINTSYNFDTLVPAILGVTYKNMRLVGIVDYNAASTYRDIAVLQRQIYPYLPVGTPDNVKRYTFLVFLNGDGEKTVFAYEWINESTIESSTTSNIIYTVYNVSPADVNKINNTLRVLGYTFTNNRP